MSSKSRSFTVSASDIGSDQILVPRDISTGDAAGDDFVSLDPSPNSTADPKYQSWCVKLVAGGSTDADIELRAGVTTAEDADFTTWTTGGNIESVSSGTTPPESVGIVFSNEAGISSVNAVLDPQSTATSGEYTVIIQSRSY